MRGLQWGRRRRGREGGVRPRRIRQFIEPALLLLLHGGPNHGYGLIEGLRDLGLEDYPVDPSAVYRILYDLEAQGILTSTQDAEQSAGPPRRVYRLTEAGDVYLSAWMEELRATDRMLHRFLDAYDTHQREHGVTEQVTGDETPPVAHQQEDEDK
jgi:PadR family transcriptional regulator PadR